MKHNIKTIALDMDGTLLNSEKKISDKTKKALIEVQNRGIQVILASGRPIKSMLKYAKELGLDKNHGVIISNNGAVGYDTRDDKLLFETPIPYEVVLEILEKIDGRDIWPMIEKGEYFLIKDAYEGVVNLDGKMINVTQLEARSGGYLLKEVRHIEDHVNMNLNKILTIVNPYEIEEVVEEFKDMFDGKVHVVQTSPYFMEFVMPQVNKANGLKKIEIDSETLMTFGDAMNDLEMIEYAKYGISMANAPQKVREKSSYVTLDNDSDGVYEALKYYGLI